VAENFDAKNKGLLAGVDISSAALLRTLTSWRGTEPIQQHRSQRTILVYPSIDAIEEFKILRNSYGPEFAARARTINIVRSARNDFHGSAFYLAATTRSMRRTFARSLTRNSCCVARLWLTGRRPRKEGKVFSSVGGME